MKKNVAGQKIGAQILNMDGTVFTSVVTVYVCGDAGTQAIGATASGSCTLEGNGFYTYGPNQAETNYDHIGFTFIGTSAIPVTLQIYPSFPQTGDNFPVVSSAATQTSTILTNVSVIVTNVSTILTFSSANNTLLGEVPTSAELVTSLAGADDAVLAAISGLNNLSQANIRTAVGLATANLDTQLDALPTNAELTTALGTADDAVLAAIGSVAAKTDQLTFTVANQVDSNAVSMNDTTILGTGAAGDLWRG